jgi:hypothetical protein
MSTCQHGPGLVLQTQEGPLQVGVENTVPIFLGQVRDGLELSFDAGVIRCVIEPSKCLNRMCHHPFDILGNCDIRDDEAGFPSPGLYLTRERRQLAFASRGKNYLGAARREGLSSRPANSTARSGNQSYFAIHV